MKRSCFKSPTKEKIVQIQQKKYERAKLAKSTKKRTSKAKLPSQRILKDRLWNECKRITRERFPNTCYTCGKQGLSGQDWQTGHGKAKGALPLRFKYDIRNLRPQCYNCNHGGNGMTDIFIARMETEEEGVAFLLDACYFDEQLATWRIRQDIPSLGGKEATIFIQNLLKQYKTMSYEN